MTMSKPLFRFNTRALSAGIQRHLQEEYQKARYAMNSVGHFGRGEIQKRTPIDEGHLTGAVTFEIVDYRKSYAVVLYVPSNSEASQYAIPMHEGVYNLGPKSLAKMAKTGTQVGPGYIIRGLDDNRGDIRDIIISIMQV